MPKYKNTPENTMLCDAISLAVLAHRGQIRKDSSEMPYVVHPLHVMRLLIDHGVMDKQILAAAVMHDVIEDTHIGIELVQRQFPKLVADLVAAMSKDCGSKGTAYVQRAADHAQIMVRVKDFKHSINLDGKKVNPAILIKQADRLSNLTGAFPEDWDLVKHQQYYEQSREILLLDTRTKLADALHDVVKNYSVFINEIRIGNH